ncbi:hypothetical protein C3L33_22220, partial [Rhododendron williamsianum]
MNRRSCPSHASFLRAEYNLASIKRLHHHIHQHPLHPPPNHRILLGRRHLRPVRDSGLDIRYATLSDGLPVEFDRSLNHDQFMAALLHVFSAHAEAAVAEIVRSGATPAPSCLIADTFYVWPSKVAKKFGLKYVSYWTEPALVFTLYYHMGLLRLNGHFGCLEAREDAIDYIPGVQSINPTDMTSYLQESDGSSVCHQINFKAFEDVKGADFVLYAHVTHNDLVEIATGLLLSGVSFVWVLRADIVSSEDPDPLPEGFREELGDRSMIIPCMWCEVPMLCFPLYTDQFTNRKLVVDDWKIGINLCDKKRIMRAEVSQKIGRLMSEKTGDKYRSAIKDVKKGLENALRPDGSSEMNLDQFIKDLKFSIQKKRTGGTLASHYRFSHSWHPATSRHMRDLVELFVKKKYKGDFSEHYSGTKVRVRSRSSFISFGPDPSIGGAVGGLPGLEVMSIPQQAEVAKKALHDNLKRMKESHGRTMASLVRNDENLTTSLLKVTALEKSLSAAGERRKIGEMVKKLSLLEEPMDVHNILLKAVTFTKRPHEAHKAPFIEELEEQMQKLNEDRAAAILKRRSSDNDDEMLELEAAINAAMSVFNKGGGRAAMIEVATREAKAASAATK